MHACMHACMHAGFYAYTPERAMLGFSFCISISLVWWDRSSICRLVTLDLIDVNALSVVSVVVCALSLGVSDVTRLLLDFVDGSVSWPISFFAR